MQVERDALKEMAKVVDTKTAPLEHLQLVVESFHKAAALPLAKVVRDEIQPGVQELEEGIEAGQRAGFNLPAPGLDAAHTCRF